MSLKKTIRFILYHPLNRNNKIKALLRFFIWQFQSRMNTKPVAIKFGEKSKLIITRGMAGATGNLYCGLHEFEDMAFLLHFLRKEDLFVDIGANIGSYTILAASEIGARTYTFEPVPVTFYSLKRNIDCNDVSGIVKAFNIGLGNRPGNINFTNTLDTVNHVSVGIEEDVISVEVKTLDEMIEIDSDCLIKIDVEGFEKQVLEGMTNILINEKLQALIIELNGSGIRYGYDDIDVHNVLLSFGFKPYSYDPMSRKLDVLKTFGSTNTIYIRNEKFVKDRLEKSRYFKILGNVF